MVSVVSLTGLSTCEALLTSVSFVIDSSDFVLSACVCCVLSAVVLVVSAKTVSGVVMNELIITNKLKYVDSFFFIRFLLVLSSFSYSTNLIISKISYLNHRSPTLIAQNTYKGKRIPSFACFILYPRKFSSVQFFIESPQRKLVGFYNLLH